MLRTAAAPILLSSALLFGGCPMSSGTRGAVAAAAFGAIAASKLLAAATGTGTPDARKAKQPPKAGEEAGRAVDTTTPTACTPPIPPAHAGCVSYVAEPHLDGSKCLYFCTDHCAYHPPAAR